MNGEIVIEEENKEKKIEKMRKKKKTREESRASLVKKLPYPYMLSKQFARFRDIFK